MDVTSGGIYLLFTWYGNGSGRRWQIGGHDHKLNPAYRVLNLAYRVAAYNQPMMVVSAASNEGKSGGGPAWLSQYGPFFRGRRAQLSSRLGTTVVLAIAFGPVLGWTATLSWLAAYALLQVSERFCFAPGKPLIPEPSRRGAYAGAAFLVAHTFVWCVLSLLAIERLGGWGFACAAIMLAGGVLNTVLNSVNCRAAYMFSMLPLVLYIVLLPLYAMDLPNHPSWFVAFLLVLCGLLFVIAAHRLWRETSITKAAEMEAVERDISTRKMNEQRLYLMAHRDALTGLANRTVLQNSLSKLIAGSDPAALLLIDLDGFKVVNDTLGHFAGDQVLVEVARRLEACARAGDITTRLGGDEFAVLLVGVGDPALALEISDRIILKIAQPLEVDGQPVDIGGSIGIVIYPAHGDDPVRLFANADLALYRAKADGRHCSRLYHPSLREDGAKKLLQDAELLQAVEQNELELFYQPQVRMEDGAVLSAEALLRWRHPVRGLLTPPAFLAAIETSPLAARIGDWVVQSACEQAAIWRREGLPDFRVAVNLFGAQFRSGCLVEKIVHAASRVNLPTDALAFEIAENTILRDDDEIAVPLTQLRALGFGIVFDDYGTGYASLSLLKRYPFSGLKIDKGFTQAICETPSDAAIVRAVISLGQAFDLQVIAAGVESREQARRLAMDGCVQAQGHYFGRPVTAADFTALYVSGASVRMNIGLS
jgi:diguanylate cyclase (GGDEF)-like protein